MLGFAMLSTDSTFSGYSLRLSPTLIWGIGMQMNVADAKAKLSELIAAAERGEEVIIARGGHAVVRLVPVHSQGVRLGALKGLVPSSSVPDFLEPMSEEELGEWGA